jgi:hypothetical protein
VSTIAHFTILCYSKKRATRWIRKGKERRKRRNFVSINHMTHILMGKINQFWSHKHQTGKNSKNMKKNLYKTSKLKERREP